MYLLLDGYILVLLKIIGYKSCVVFAEKLENYALLVQMMVYSVNGKIFSDNL